MPPAFSQGLFESSLSGVHENEVSNSITLGGFIRSVAYVGNNPENDLYYFQSAYAQAGLLVGAKAGSWATARADLRFRYGTEFGHPVSEIILREAYVDLSAGPVDLRFGKLISPWGKGSVFNPAEKITPLDPTVRSPEEDDIYLGVWALRGRINMGSSMNLTATWKPVYQASVLLIDPIPLPGYVNFLDPDYPGPELKEGSYGINYSLHAPLLDASVYWFDGYSHWPGIGFDSFILDSATFSPIALNLREQAYRIRMLGIDLSIPVNAWIIRAEGAWSDPVDGRAGSEYIPFPEISYTAEIERSGTHMTWLGGYYGKYIMEFEAPAASPSLGADLQQFYGLIQQGLDPVGGAMDNLIKENIASFNRLYNYQLEEFYHMAYFVGRGNFLRDRLEIVFPVIYSITTEEWTIRPGISWLPWDGMKVSAGFSGMYGPGSSLYDMVGPVLNAAWLSFKLTF